MMSAGVYLRLTGYTFDFGEADRRLGLNGRMPRALLVVHSGKTTIYLLGLRAARVSRSIMSALLDGEA